MRVAPALGKPKQEDEPLRCQAGCQPALHSESLLHKEGKMGALLHISGSTSSRLHRIDSLIFLFLIFVFFLRQCLTRYARLTSNADPLASAPPPLQIP